MTNRLQPCALWTRSLSRRRRQAGLASLGLILLVAFVLMALGISGLEVSLYNRRTAVREENLAQTFNIAEAGVQKLELDLWTQFRATSNFTWHDGQFAETTGNNPETPVNGTGQWPVTANLPADTAYSPSVARRFAASIVYYQKTDLYKRDITIRSVGWLDLDNSGGTGPNGNEPSTTVVQRIRLAQDRAGVFDYVYFVNNFGWMTGFATNALLVNGDMRANGNIAVDGGTINGQIIAAANPNIYDQQHGHWGAEGIADIAGTSAVTNQTNVAYTAAVAGTQQAPQAYNSLIHGSKTATTFAKWKDVLYDQTADASITQLNGQMYGSVISDSTGTKQLSDRAVMSQTVTSTVAMPDLSDINVYKGKSTAWIDTTQTYQDGTSNPNYNQGAWVKIWDSATSKYKTVTGQSGDPAGVVTASAALFGDDLHPILIHGPVTVVGDIAIKGKVSGQGTLYAGRNIHIIGSVTYADPPSFLGTNADNIDKANEKKTVLGLCARGSIIMGNTTKFSSSNNNPLNYMKPPTTTDRKDDVTKQTIAAFNGAASDTGYTMVGGGTPQRYQSLFGDAFMNANATAPAQIDAIMYTNNCAGGMVGDGTNFTINGALISRDEAMVAALGTGGAMRMNYDSRIKERSLNNIVKPLIDIDLPRSPSLSSMGWVQK